MATITPRDRLSFTLFLAASLHAAIILGVGFSASMDSIESPTIEITLAQFNDPEPSEDADFAAQANQQGSGTEAEVMEMTTDQEADFQDNVFQDVAAETLPAQEAELLEKRELLTSTQNPEDAVTTVDTTPTEAINSPLTQNYDALAKEIASLEARIAQERQALAKGPRVRRLTSVSTKTADEAAYLNMWRQKVERIGNNNYPSGVQGDLRMLVVITWDGKLKDLRILQSSGQRELDDAALNIVRIAAPYQPFPVEMRKKYDQLEIIRTWKFSRAGASLGS
ncbi:MAG: TonB family protein [Pseudomonadota bacterium]